MLDNHSFSSISISSSVVISTSIHKDDCVGRHRETHDVGKDRKKNSCSQVSVDNTTRILVFTGGNNPSVICITGGYESLSNMSVSNVTDGFFPQ